MTNENEKAVQIFSFAKALNELKYPVVKDMSAYDFKLNLHELPTYKTISIGFPLDNGADGQETAEYLLKIKRPKLTDALAETQSAARKAYDLYEKIYSVYSRMTREGDSIELILGDGFFRYLPDGVDHPVILLRFQISFDPIVPEFTIYPCETPTVLNSRLLRQIRHVDVARILDFEQKIEQECIHPYAGQEVDDILIEMVHSFSSEGKFLNRGESDEKTDTALVCYRNPTLFIRKRGSNILSALDTIINDLKSDAQFPSPLVNITGINTADRKADDADDDTEESKLLRVNGISKDILFAKPANEEQLQIAIKIEHSNAVLVQGPPGTGKTHTIANLIGHFMGQGKSVLVTSYSAKALKVLKDKIPKSLQPLCVSVIDEDKKQLEQAVTAINDHLTQDNSEALRLCATQYETQRNQTIDELCSAKTDMKTIIDSEYREITFEGASYSTKEAAVFVKDYSQAFGWIPGKIMPLVPLPLCHEELVELYESNRKINSETESELDCYIPEPYQFILPDEFSKIIELIHNNQDNDIGNGFWNATADTSSADLYQILKEVRKSARLFESKDEWKIRAAFSGTNRELYMEPWQKLFEIEPSLLTIGAKMRNVLIDFDTFVPAELICDDTLTVLKEIIEAAYEDKSISKLTLAFRPTWKRIIKRCQINGKEPLVKREFEVLLEFCSYRLKQLQITKYFRKLITDYGGPDISDENQVELTVKELIPDIQTYLDWDASWGNIIKSLVKAGFDWNGFYSQLANVISPYGEIEKALNALDYPMTAYIEAEYRRHLCRETEEKLKAYRSIFSSDGSSLSIQMLICAIDQLDAEAYREAFNNIVALRAYESVYARRKELLQKLSSKAPEWADSIKNRKGIHGSAHIPGSPDDAWKWLQLNEELDRRESLDIKEVQSRINILNSRLMHITEELLESKAWLHELETVFDLTKRQALFGWAKMVKSVGHGTGKKAKKLLQQVKEQMKLCKSSVPVFIMPLNKVVENFVPGETKFDVVIIDEASQADVTGLIALYLGKKVIVVGDDKQVSPDQIGIEVKKITQLQDQYLQGIMNKQLYNEKLSLYDMAKWTFSPHQLTEHFRCIDKIVGYSNHYYYEGHIMPLRDGSRVSIRPATVALKVNGHRDSNKTNRIEAETIVAMIEACIEQPEYENASIGVISMLGSSQAALIDDMLRKKLNESDYQKHQIMCGDPPHFQGDERDVIFLTMVDCPNENDGPLTLKSGGAFDINFKRFNVAASRAKDQMWVVYSLYPDADLKPGDIREQLIRYAMSPDAVEQRIDKNTENAKSEFEVQVISSLTLHDYHVYSQWHVGTYQIDIVVQYQGKRIAIECDGERWHGPDKLMDEMTRQSILERLGWQFIRIRGSRYFRNPKGTMKDVFNQLNQLGIFPEKQQSESVEEQTFSLRNKVEKRAYQIMKKGTGKLESDSGSQTGGKKLVSDTDVSTDETSKPVDKASSKIEPQFNFDVVEYLKEQGLTVIDSRKSSLLIWVIGDLGIQKILSDLKQKGFNFVFEKKGSIATNGRPAFRCTIH